ncbi:MAG: PD-(D/E)XK nuclease family protein, partial [Proteobacteria bacterium]|nr:PD-(D/E)XK nuclease family protein [Pseudomonadota bacterium]
PAQVRIPPSEIRIPQSCSGMPRPVVPVELIPQHISPSGYNALVACPYQYFARHVLHLNELDEVREDLDKRDYGSWVHAILQRFHDENPLLQSQKKEAAERVMLRISDEVFADGLAHDYLAQAWLLRWQAQIPAYLDWQLQNEDAGWRYQGSEVPFKIEVAENLQLRGRLDRVDVYLNEPQKLAVLDYKTQSIQILKNKLKEPGEDVQLACYAQAVGAGAAAFVSLEDETVLAVSPPDDIVALAKLNLERLQTVFTQLRNGAALPAHGAEKICGYCEMKGLCRRGEWQEAAEKGEGGREKRVDCG